MVNVYRPQSLSEALEIIAFTECTVFAGGTDLMVKKKQWTGLMPAFEKPVLFISELKELREIRIEDEFLYIGSACTFSGLLDSLLIPESYKQVFMEIASPAVRNIATIGGNICNSSPAGDSLPLLYALDAVIIIESSCRKLEVPIQEFITGPGRNVLNSGELVTAIKLPLKSFEKVVYRKVSTRKSTALSKVSFVAMAVTKENKLHDIRIAFGAVAPTIIRSRDIEEEIIYCCSKGYLDKTEIIRDYATLIKPIDDQRSTAFYRREVCKRLLTDYIDNNLAMVLRDGEMK
jgi:CO/xanthine dehydrogenase FAD-binding subunit